MKKSLHVVTLIFILSLSLVSGCGGGPSGGGGGGGDPTTTRYTVKFNVYDKTDGKSLSDVALSIEETGQLFKIDQSLAMKLDKGTYTLYLGKDGYITRGFVFNLTSDLTFNTYLTPQKKEDRGTDLTVTVSFGPGETLEDYSIYAGNQFKAELVENPTIPTVTIKDVVSGKIVVSAFTLEGGKIKQIAYSAPSTNPAFTLQFSGSAKTYTGTKPPEGKLTVKQQDGYFLAEEANNESGYSFSVEPWPGDSIILESLVETGENTYFTRIDAGSNGGTNQISHQYEVPTFHSSSDENYLSLNINPVGFADYYEVIAIQVNEDEQKVLCWNAILSGNRVKVPNGLLNLGTDDIVIIVRAVELPGFRLINFLNESPNLICPPCAYTDTMERLLDIKTTTSIRRSSASSTRDFSQIRAKLNLNSLCIE